MHSGFIHEDLFPDFRNWEGITWGYTIAIICCAFAGKFGGCALAARYLAGFNWRESGAIGSLMSCKGWASLVFVPSCYCLWLRMYIGWSN